MYAGEVGVPRLLKLFKKYNITTTWFIPGMMRCSILNTDDLQIVFCTHYYTGHSLETFPDQMAAVRDAGHEMFVQFFNILSEIYREQTSTMYCNIADFTDTLTK